ncbi:MAG: PAS domain-containing protein [Euryarchaeota archaeon]|nr:PAS domain-containing protein [Euryarchaeota archaeon]
MRSFAEIVREQRTFKNMENQLRTRDGRSVCMLTSGGPIFDDAGELLGYRGVDSDITERKNAEGAVCGSEEKLRTITASANDAIIMMDHEGKISYWNKAAKQMFGYTEERS